MSGIPWPCVRAIEGWNPWCLANGIEFVVGAENGGCWLWPYCEDVAKEGVASDEELLEGVS